MIKKLLNRVLLILMCSISLSLQGALILPLIFRSSADLQQFKSQEFNVKIQSYFDNSHKQLEECIGKFSLIKSTPYLQKIKNDVKHLSISDAKGVFDTLNYVEPILGIVDTDSRHACQQLRAAAIAKSTEKLLENVYKKCIEIIILLEGHAHYWNNQYKHQNYYFFHRSPLKWFGSTSRKAEIINNKERIENALKNHQKMIGEIAFLASEFNEEASLEELYEWIFRCYSTINSLLPTALYDKAVFTQEKCLSVIEQINNFFHNYKYYTLKNLHNALMPSHIERNWALYTVITAVVTASFWYMYNNPNALSDTSTRMSDFCMKNYINHVKDPILDIKNAFFIKKNDATSAGEQLKKIINNDLKPSEESLNQLKKDYCAVVKDINQTFRLNITLNEIEQKSLALDENYLDSLMQTIGVHWEKGGIFFESYWDPFSATSKSKVANKYPSLGVLYVRVLKANGKLLISELAEVAITRMAKMDYDIQEIQQKKLNLVLAVVAFLPAAGAIWGMYKGLRSFGGYMLPKGYDDTPIRTYIMKMQDIIDEALYVNKKKELRDIDSYLLGKLFYYAAQLEKEIVRVSKKNREKMQDFFEKFYITTTLKGKKMYLEKMLHEYYSWPRFVQQKS